VKTIPNSCLRLITIVEKSLLCPSTHWSKFSCEEGPKNKKNKNKKKKQNKTKNLSTYAIIITLAKNICLISKECQQCLKYISW
jgi:hypothetical protein